MSKLTPGQRDALATVVRWRMAYLAERIAEADRLRAAVALHQPERTLLLVERCAECTAPWPCPTVQAAEGPR